MSDLLACFMYYFVNNSLYFHITITYLLLEINYSNKEMIYFLLETTHCYMGKIIFDWK